jgi:tetratricopeptide (TPR) repeat protein
MDSLDQIYDQAQKRASHTLKQLRVSSPNFDGIVALHQDQMAWVQYIGQERARLFGIMAERNDSGKASERQGQLAEAVALYEANVEDRFSGSFAYDRLRIIYTRQGQYADAIRVCQAYLDRPIAPMGKTRRAFNINSWASTSCPYPIESSASSWSLRW